jgi:hypothetical protein
VVSGCPGVRAPGRPAWWHQAQSCYHNGLFRAAISPVVGGSEDTYKVYKIEFIKAIEKDQEKPKNWFTLFG